MKLVKTHPNDDCVVVRVMNSAGGLEDIVIRNTHEKIKLGGKGYFRYQIVKPKGYEKEEIIHRIGRSHEGLICSVFMTLAAAGSRQYDKRAGISLPNRRCPGSGGNPERRHSCFEHS